MKKKLSAASQKKLELIIVIFIGVLSIFFWDTFFIYPIKFCVIIFHEISHGIFSILTGGHIVEIKVNSNLSGTCITKGGNAIIIASAGYLGSLVFGALLFLSAYNVKSSLWTNTIIAIILVGFASSFISSTTGIIAAFLLAILLFISPRYLYKSVHSYTMKILGLVSSLYVLVDIKTDLLTLQQRQTDAQILYNLTGVPAFIWALIWLGITVGVVYYLLKSSYQKGLTI